jgi:hypothetical protein
MSWGTKKITVVFSLGLIFLAVFFSCKNPLISVIEQEVAIAITPPEVASVFPLSGTANVAVSTNYISIDFTKPIAAVSATTANITITDEEGQKLSGSWSVSETTATFTPSGSLAYASRYTVTVTSGLLDTDGNPLSEEYSWMFTTGFAPDAVAPVVNSVTVNQGSVWSNSLSVILDIDASDNNDTAFLSAIAQMNINNSGWQPFSASSSYTLSPGDGVRTVSVSVKDGSGNESAAGTGTANIDTAGPEITNLSLNNGASATNSNTIDIDVYVSDNNGSGASQFRYRLEGGLWQAWQNVTDSDGTIIGNVSGLLIAASLGESQVIETQAVDSVGNISSVVSESILFEQTPPSVIERNFSSGELFPYNGTLLRIIFDEEMDPGSFTSTDFTLKEGANPAVIPGTISFTESSVAENSVAELWGFELQPNTQYKVELSNAVEDIAGNSIGGSGEIWYFNTGDAVDTTPPSGPVALTELYGNVETLPSFSIATDTATVELDFSNVADDYNIPYGIKIWGDNDGTFPATEKSFEQEASWIAWPATEKITWHLSSGSGVKYILYKFMDAAGNESTSPNQMKVILDTSEPVISNVSINNGDTHTNNAEREVTIDITANDVYAGLKEMMISNNSNFIGAVWQEFQPTIDNWVLDDTEGQRYIYIKVRDYLDVPSTGLYYTDSGNPPSITLDRTDPVINWNTTFILENSELQLDVGGIYSITESSGIAQYQWEKISGTGSLYFNSVSGGGIANDGAALMEPWLVSAGEGSFFIKLTLIDNAGNTSNASLPFEWDTTLPGDILNLAVSEFNTNGQPDWSWDAVADADYYRTSYDVGFSPYIDVYTNSFTPNAPLTPDGNKTLYVKAYDNAGNSSVPLNETVRVDTESPTITVGTSSFITNAAIPSITANFAGTHGSVADNGDNPTGIETYQWTKASGPGNLSFGTPSANTTSISADADGNYQVRLSATDFAGNTSSVYLSLLSDVNIPGTPSVSGPDITPSLTPTWIWTSGGDGNGYYRYSLNGGAYEYTYNTSYSTSVLDGNDYTLQVWENDAADNWSLAGSKLIHIDINAQIPPIITIGDGEPALRKIDSALWRVSTGAPGVAEVDAYRWQVNSLDTGGWTYIYSSLPDSPTFSNVPSGGLNSLSDGSYRLYVEERKDGIWQDSKRASHTVVVDTTPPAIPTITGSGNATGDTDRTAYRYNVPTWSWSSGGGGNGTYSYRLSRTNIANGNVDGTCITLVDWSADTTATSYTSASLSEGTYVLEVVERDDAGNYSTAGSLKTTIDTSYPTLSSVYIDSVYRHPDDTDDTYTNNTYIEVDVGGNISSEVNSAYNRPVKLNVYDYNNYTWDDFPTAWNESNLTSESFNTYLPTSNGTRRVYVRLIDEAGNITSSISDTVILDTVDPSASFNINGGSATTPSLSAYLNLSASDNLSGAADLEVRTRYNGVYGNYKSYSTSMLSDFQFLTGAGSKTVEVQFRDAAGNVTSLISDTITLEVPVPRYAWKGYYSTGATRVYFDPVTEPAGDATTYYYTYYSTNSGANPNGGGSVTSLGATSATTYDYVSGIPKGELLYFWTRAYNSDTGGYGPYSATSVMGFSSNVTVVYDDDDAADVTRANELKALLEDDQNITSSSVIYGTMPTWTVTLLPEDDISNSYDEVEPYHYRIYGDPVILTPGVIVGSYTGRTRNIASTSRGVIAMGSAGGTFLYRVDLNWTTWGLSGYRPSDIDSGNQMTLTARKDAKTRPSTGSEDIWYTPLYYSTLYSSYRETSIGVNIFSADTSRRGVHSIGAVPPSGGAIYAGDYSSSAHWPVIRQGDFLFFGYEDVPNVNATGEVFFINLVARMEDF